MLSRAEQGDVEWNSDDPLSIEQNGTSIDLWFENADDDSDYYENYWKRMRASYEIADEFLSGAASENSYEAQVIFNIGHASQTLWLPVIGLDERDEYGVTFVVKRTEKLIGRPHLPLNEPHAIQPYNILEFRKANASQE